MANIASIKVRKTNTVYGIQDAAASLAIEQMKNGTDIDSFGDVETALAGKADASDLDDYVQKSNTAGLLKNDGSVDTNEYLTNVPWASSSQIGGIRLGNSLTVSTPSNNTVNVLFSNIVEDGQGAVNSGTVYTALQGKADKVVRELTSSDDLDNIIDYGTYAIKTSPAHVPESADYCTLLVTPSSTIGTGAVIQTIIRYDRIYVRRRGSGNWSSWYKFTGTALS